MFPEKSIKDASEFESLFEFMRKVNEEGKPEY